MQLSKKNIISSVAFFLGLLILVWLSSAFFRPKNNAERYGMEEPRANGILSEPEETLDVFFVGDSISYASIIPIQIWRDHGITSYLCGSTMQDLYYTKEFVNKAFETQSPEIVFLGTATIFNEFTEKEKIWNSLEQLVPILRYHDRWKSFVKWPEWETGFKVDYVYCEPGKGYYYSLGVEGIDATGYAFETPAVEWVPDINKKTLWEIKEICDAQGAQLILLSEPNVAGSWGPHRHNAAAILAEEMGVEYIDLNYLQKEVPIDWMKDTFDGGDHLNYYGAQKVTAYLGQYLAETGLFEDKRENPDYDFWNETQTKFYEGKPE